MKNECLKDKCLIFYSIKLNNFLYLTLLKEILIK